MDVLCLEHNIYQITFMKRRPGEKVEISGIYSEINLVGFSVSEVTCVRGEPFPPTVAPGYYYELKHAAKHKVHG